MDISITRLKGSQAGYLRDGSFEPLEGIEMAVHPVLPVRVLQEDPSRALVIIEQAKKELGRFITSHVEEAQDRDPDQPHLNIQVIVEPECLPVVEPTRSLYDPPPEWDEYQQKLVLAEGAVKIGETEPYLGWVLYTVVAIVALPTPPSGRDEVIDPASHFFWTKPLNLTVDEIHERLMTTVGWGKLSVEIGRTFGFGNKPVAPA